MMSVPAKVRDFNDKQETLSVLDCSCTIGRSECIDKSLHHCSKSGAPLCPSHVHVQTHVCNTHAQTNKTHLHTHPTHPRNTRTPLPKHHMHKIMQEKQNNRKNQATS